MPEPKLLLLCDDPFVVADITWSARRAGFAVFPARYQESARDALVRVDAQVVLVHRAHPATGAADFQTEAATRKTCVLVYEFERGRQEITLHGRSTIRVELRAGKEAAFYAAVRNACHLAA